MRTPPEEGALPHQGGLPAQDHFAPKNTVLDHAGT